MVFEKELEWFIANQERLVRDYSGRYLLIMDEEVIGDYDSVQSAYDALRQKGLLGKAMIQHCLPGKDAYTTTFFSGRVAFG